MKILAVNVPDGSCVVQMKRGELSKLMGTTFMSSSEFQKMDSKEIDIDDSWQIISKAKSSVAHLSNIKRQAENLLTEVEDTSIMIHTHLVEQPQEK